MSSSMWFLMNSDEGMINMCKVLLPAAILKYQAAARLNMFKLGPAGPVGRRKNRRPPTAHECLMATAQLRPAAPRATRAAPRGLSVPQLKASAMETEDLTRPVKT